MGRDDGHALVADGNLLQQPRIGLNETFEIPVLVDCQRATDKTLFVDDLRIPQIFFRTDDVVDRVEAVLQVGFLAAQIFDLRRTGLHLFGQCGHFDAALFEFGA